MQAIFAKKICNQFKKKFKTEPVLLVQSPGRVNLIGEHTDYNNGFVLPAAIDKKIVLAFARNGLRKARFYSADMDEFYEVDLEDKFLKSELHWPNYIVGVVDQFQKNGGYAIEGFDCVFVGDIPIGAGLSSSAALEGGMAFGLAQLFDFPVSRLEMATLSQKAENEFVGMQCGIMDQFASIHGKKGYVLKLDCRSLKFEFYPFRNPDIQVILCDTGIHRKLTSSEYNIRRQQCEEGVKILQNHHSEMESLRDADLSILEKYKDDFTPLVYKRCTFVLEENARVEAACNDLLNDDFKSFGQRMYKSHYGLRDLYEVSCEELDLLVKIAEQADGVFGSRMMGGGFGGCTINLVEQSKVENFVDHVKRLYREKIGEEIKVYHASISDGTKRIFTESFA